MRTGVQWRDLPEEFGLWNTVFWRFNLQSRKGISEKVFEKLALNNDPEWLFIDGNIIKSHQDSCGLPVYFELSGGQVHDVIHAKSLIEHSPQSSTVTADKGYDSEEVREYVYD